MSFGDDTLAPEDPLVAENRRLREAGRQMQQAVDELLTEFVSKKRAANWFIINEALVAMGSALRSKGSQ